MAGHSKWSNIQHRKNAQDAKRNKIFTKIIREVGVAARMGDPNPEFNPRLRQAIDKALAANMTKDRIEHAVKKAAGELDGQNYEEIRYEGRGPGGVAIIIDCLTDNKNRTVSEVRHCLSKKAGALSVSGSAAYLFEKKGYIACKTNEDQAMELAMEFPIEDIELNEDQVLLTLSDPTQTHPLKAHIESLGMPITHYSIDLKAINPIQVDLEIQENIQLLVDQLEDLDDVQMVYTNTHFE